MRLRCVTGAVFVQGFADGNLLQGGIVNVFIVEDSESVRTRLQAMLSGIPGVAVTGLAVDEAGAIAGVESLSPDVVILDLHLQRGSGLKVLSSIKKDHAATRVIVLTNFSNDSCSSYCKQAGADYFFDKSFQFMLVGAALQQLASRDQPGGKPDALQPAITHQ
ncbi:MAG: response regulator transcription factor [Nitrosomonadales bacterium]|nr:response regulator transcription factor [Nitrosomonadales bacterium]